MDNHSLDITELLRRINMQARLIGGPCQDAPVVLPPMMYGLPPEYVCVTRPNDLTHYHYIHAHDFTYHYADHCDTYEPWPHHPWDPNMSDKSRNRRLFAGVGTIILVASALVMVGLIIKLAEVFGA